MKKSWLLLIISILFSTMLFLNTISVSGATDESEDNIQYTKVIKIAIHDANRKVYRWGSSAHSYFPKLDPTYDAYTWVVDGRCYILDLIKTNTKDIENGVLQNEDIHVLVMDGMHDEQFLCAHPLIAFIRRVNVKEIQHNLRDFIENESGGFIGICGGAYHPLNSLEINSIMEQDFNKNTFLGNIVDIYWDVTTGYPIIDEYSHNPRGIYKILPYKEWPSHTPDPTVYGADSYVFYSGTNINNKAHWFGGDCIWFDIVRKDHPIFEDYEGDRFYCNWNGGPAFYINPEVANDVSILANGLADKRTSSCSIG